MLNDSMYFDENPTAGGTPSTPTPSGENETHEEIKDLPAWAQQIIKELRGENAARRTALKQAEEKQRQIEAERLVEQGKWKELAEARQVEIETLKPLTERLKILEDRQKASNEARVKRIPENMRSLVPTALMPDALGEWLDANESILTKRQAPDLNAGAQGDGSTPITLTVEQAQLARSLGFTDAQYADMLKKMQAKNTPVPG